MRDIPEPALDAPAADWQVYGDALQDAGDLRGELIAFHHANELAARDAFVREHWAALVGDVPKDEVVLDWHYGAVRRATCRIVDGESTVVGKLLASNLRPHTIELRGIGTVDLTKPMDALARAATCRRFVFADDRATKSLMLVSRDYEPPANLVRFGPLAKFWTRAESMEIDVADCLQLDFGVIDAPELVHFALRGLNFADGNNDEAISETLGEASWPKLESFELRCTEMWMSNVPLEREPYTPVYSAPDYNGNDDADEGDLGGVDWSAFSDLFATLAGCPLRRLALTSISSTASLLEALAEVGLAPTVRELDLSDSLLQDREVAWLLEHRAFFAQLDRLVIERTPVTASALAGLGPKIVHSPGGGATYRYVVGQE